MEVDRDLVDRVLSGVLGVGADCTLVGVDLSLQAVDWTKAGVDWTSVGVDWTSVGVHESLTDMFLISGTMDSGLDGEAVFVSSLELGAGCEVFLEGDSS